MKRTREVYEYINTWLDELKPEVTEIVTEVVNDWCLSVEPEISKFVMEAKNNFKQEIIKELLESDEFKKMVKRERSDESEQQEVPKKRHQKITFDYLMSRVCGKTVDEATTILKNEFPKIRLIVHMIDGIMCEHPICVDGSRCLYAIVRDGVIVGGFSVTENIWYSL